MAGAGFKTFSAGEVLLASEVNTFLMQQAVMVFDSAAARDGVITAPSEGMLCYLKDTNQVEKYTGSDWVAVVEDTSPITTEGDLIVGDATGVPIRLPVGTAGQVLTSDGDTVSFVTPVAGGAFTLLSTTTMSNVATIYTVTGIDQTFKALRIVIDCAYSSGGNLFIRAKNSGGTNQNFLLNRITNGALATVSQTTLNLTGVTDIQASTSGSSFVIDLIDYTRIESTNAVRCPVFIFGTANTGGGENNTIFAGSNIKTNTTIAQIEIGTQTGTFDFGKFRIFGVN